MARSADTQQAASRIGAFHGGETLAHVDGGIGSRQAGKRELTAGREAKGPAAMLAKEVICADPGVQQCIERLRDDLAAELKAARTAVRLTEDGWFYRKGGEWLKVPWVLSTVDSARPA